MLMELAIKTLWTCAFIPCSPQRAHPLAVKVEERGGEERGNGLGTGGGRQKHVWVGSVWVCRLPFVSATGTHPAYYPNHTKSNRRRMSFGKHSLDSTVNWINIFTGWLGLTAAQSTPTRTISESLTVLAEFFFNPLPPPRHCSLSSSGAVSTCGGEAVQTQTEDHHPNPNPGMVSHEWR